MEKSNKALAVGPVAPKPLTEAGKKLRELIDEKEKVEARLKDINKQIVKVETIDLPKLMEDNEIPSFKVAGVGTIFLTTEVYVSVLKDDRPKLYEWAREQGHGGMITDWIFPNTFTAFVKRQLDDQVENGITQGNAVPDFVKVTQIPTANLRRTNGKGGK